jgi:DNA-binding transcriptional regulator YdaS (Cro superfamily)
MNTAAARKAVKAAGGHTALARTLGVSRQLVYYWAENGVPAQWCLKVEHATGVSRHKLRPDVYGPQP